MLPTFLASLRAVGTASTMAGAGWYLHRKNFVTPSGKKMMALISQQVTIPAYLFAKIIYCPSGSGGGEAAGGAAGDLETPAHPEVVCPSVADRIPDLWMLCLWPFFVVACGLLTGYVAAKVSNTPPVQTRSCLAACAFGNSTGLAITLLSVIHKQFSKRTELGRIDPTAFLSVYLLLYPVLQWGVGGWLLAPEEKPSESSGEGAISMVFQSTEQKDGEKRGVAESTPLLPTEGANSQTNGAGNTKHKRSRSSVSHILNYEEPQSPAMTAGDEEFGGVRSRRVILAKRANNGQSGWQTAGFSELASSNSLAMMVKELSFTSLQDMPHSRSPTAVPALDIEGDHDGPLTMDASGFPAVLDSPPTIHEHVPFASNGQDPKVYGCATEDADGALDPQQIRRIQDADILPFTETLLRILRKVFQPPVIGALLGLFIASFPALRGLLQNIWADDGKAAPLQFLFDGVYTVSLFQRASWHFSASLGFMLIAFSLCVQQVGQAAVPINMMILGINLSSTFQQKNKEDDETDKIRMLPNRTMLAVVIGKMIVMPIIGIVSTWFLQKYYIDFPDGELMLCFL